MQIKQPKMKHSWEIIIKATYCAGRLWETLCLCTRCCLHAWGLFKPHPVIAWTRASVEMLDNLHPALPKKDSIDCSISLCDDLDGRTP